MLLSVQKLLQRPKLNEVNIMSRSRRAKRRINYKRMMFDGVVITHEEEDCEEADAG